MPRTESLSKILNDVAQGRRPEGDFFLAMLEERMYTLAPLSDDHPRLRLIMYQRPDGQLFVPLFTDAEKARLSAQSALRVIEGTGRELLEQTLGALVMINPNDEGCTLYPEECKTLVTTGEIGSFGQSKLRPQSKFLARPPQESPTWLLSTLANLYATLPFVDEAYVVEVQHLDPIERSVLTIVIVTPQSDAERAARATLAVTHAECSLRNFAFDITTGDPAGKRNSLITSGLRFYARGK